LGGIHSLFLLSLRPSDWRLFFCRVPLVDPLVILNIASGNLVGMPVLVFHPLRTLTLRVLGTIKAAALDPFPPEQ